MENLSTAGKRTCRVVVHRARNLKPRGKDSKNSAFVTISLGKEKFATSVVEKSQNPEWNEDCELTVRPRDSKVELTVLHQDFFIERFLGKVEIPLMEIEAAPKRSIRGWYKLSGKATKNKKEEKQRGEIEITAQIKGDESTTIFQPHVNVQNFARLDVHPLRKSTSTPYIASQKQTSTNPFDEDDPEDDLQRVPSSPVGEPDSPQGTNQRQKSPMSHIQKDLSQRESSPTFQRQGMGRKIVRTSIRKEKEALHGSTPDLSGPKDEIDSPLKRQASTSSQTSTTTLPNITAKFKKKSLTLSSQDKNKDAESNLKVPKDGSSSPRPILRALSEECLSKSAEGLEEKEQEQPSKRIFYKPAVKSARRSKAISQYYCTQDTSPSNSPPHESLPSSLPSSPTGTSSPVGEEVTAPSDGTAKGPYANHPYQSLSKDELIKRLMQLEAEVKEKDRQLSHQERYIDELLLKVITVAPGLLDKGYQPKPSIKAKTPVQRYQAKKQEVVI